MTGLEDCVGSLKLLTLLFKKKSASACCYRKLCPGCSLFGISPFLDLFLGCTGDKEAPECQKHGNSIIHSACFHIDAEGPEEKGAMHSLTGITVSLFSGRTAVGASWRYTECRVLSWKPGCQHLPTFPSTLAPPLWRDDSQSTMGRHPINPP